MLSYPISHSWFPGPYLIARETGKRGFFWEVMCLSQNQEFYYYCKEERDIGVEVCPMRSIFLSVLLVRKLS